MSLSIEELERDIAELVHEAIAIAQEVISTSGNNRDLEAAAEASASTVQSLIEEIQE